MSKLKGIYIAENNLAEFGKRMYQLCQYLPKEISEEEPFIYCLMQMTLYLGR